MASGIDTRSLPGPVAALERLRALVLEAAPFDQPGHRRAVLEEALARVEDLLAGLPEEAAPAAGPLDEASEETYRHLLRYRELFEFAPDCYLVTDAAGNILQANLAATELFGRPKEFLLGKPLAFLILAEERRAFFTRLGQLHAGAEPDPTWEARVARPKGPPPWAAVLVTATAGTDDEAAQLRWLLRDITARKQVEQALGEEKDFSDTLLETAQAAVLVLDADGHICRVNAYLEELCGRCRAELLGQPWCPTLLPIEHKTAVRAQREVVLAANKAARVTYPLVAADGSWRTLRWSLKALAGSGEPGILAVGHDITDLERAQQQALQLARLAAIGQMAAGLAHESRNALQRGRACIEMLRWRLQGQPEALDLVGRIHRAQQDLLQLYEEVQDYAAHVKLSCQSCDLPEVWREVWENLTTMGPPRDAGLVEETADVNPTCVADRFRLRQVFRNILDNSLAACADPVRITVTCRETSLGERPAVEIAFRDNGPGLSPEERRRLFEPFYTTKVRGTGLGMPIAKRIVEAHGGQIAVGQGGPPGAAIVVTLPRSQS
jgi:PAS domain S-box-containing protein